MERIDDLQTRGLRIIQNPELFCFSSDAVLLADFARVHPGDRVIDLGAGNGILDLLMYARQPQARYWALEIQRPLFDLMHRSILLNHLEGFIHPVEGDIKDAASLFGRANNVVVCNPPYEKRGSGKPRRSPTHDIARQEVRITLQEICVSASALLRTGGRFYLCCRTARLAETIHAMKENRLEPKLLRLCRPHPCDEPSLFLLMARKDGHEGLRVAPDLILLDEYGRESAEVSSIYNRENHHAT